MTHTSASAGALIKKTQSTHAAALATRAVCANIFLTNGDHQGVLAVPRHS